MAAPNPGSSFNVPSSGAPVGPSSSSAPKKRKGHRAGKKKKRDRRKSFAITNDEMHHDEGMSSSMANPSQSFYGQRHNLSGTSIDSETLLDHREHNYFMRPRRPSNAHQSPATHQPSQSIGNLKAIPGGGSADEDDNVATNERAPLLSARLRSEPAMSFGAFPPSDTNRVQSSQGRESSGTSGRRDLTMSSTFNNGYDVNYPPSIPGSPRTRAADRDWRLEDAMLIDELDLPGSPHHDDSFTDQGSQRTASPKAPATPFERRHTFDFEAQEDVCFPHEGESEMGDEELRSRRHQRVRSRKRRIRGPQLAFLEEFAHFEKEGRSEATKAKKITEPQLINGRLRPIQKGWYQPEEDAPYRFTYFNDEFQSTIHSSTISELVQSEGQGSSFRELFIPDRPILSDTSDSESDDDDVQQYASDLRRSHLSPQNGGSKDPTRQASVAGSAHGASEQARSGTLSPSKTQGGSRNSRQASGEATPVHPRSVASPPPQKEEKPVRYGERPVWWLDVLSPSDTEMRAIARTFGIHGLTTEDIMMQEAREKVELFQHYYFVHYRTFNQDPSSEDYLEPINLYIVVFRDGVLSFHFSPTPHPANVRRRIRMLRDYMFLTPDWIAYAIIDDITDVYQPLIQSVEEEVDEIDADIVKLHAEEDPRKIKLKTEKTPFSDARSTSSGSTFVETGADMLRRVGECRKKVMGLYRLLGSKADVIKGFAKRCNEQWEVAPRSDIGIYLGDIQDHIVTMTGNLSHYEMILARSHQNYLAQINIRMNERAEQTNDVLGKLTVLGTIVLPMNIITGLWGMNVWVPGQEYEGNLTWFWCITAGLLLFGLACFLIAKRIYRIV
ncbi:CorA metal ion transporter [Gnomoniopsis smithogilvyi]|uniref:CorA metal ion transporter n=1 Tax=Gnomoniopsis smithogilvyi TaxID=1191159 RepID=A0A9W8Z2W0_9PEZI|nr:CorA metal ion transporter [Gnomoniopsis smithogilvyi]